MSDRMFLISSVSPWPNSPRWVFPKQYTDWSEVLKSNSLDLIFGKGADPQRVKCAIKSSNSFIYPQTNIWILLQHCSFFGYLSLILLAPDRMLNFSVVFLKSERSKTTTLWFCKWDHWAVSLECQCHVWISSFYFYSTICLGKWCGKSQL